MSEHTKTYGYVWCEDCADAWTVSLFEWTDAQEGSEDCPVCPMCGSYSTQPFGRPIDD